MLPSPIRQRILGGVHTLETALQSILDQVSPLGSESITLSQATGRRVFNPLSSSVDLPPFDNSAMDGYAVRAQDVGTARADHPVTLNRIDRIPAGSTSNFHVREGTCIRIFTGSPLPSGADAVVMQEDTRIVENDPNLIQILDKAAPWENIRFKGEDVSRGKTLLQPGELCTPARLGILAACGVARLDVYRRPAATVIATGNELCEPGDPLPPGCLYESNRIVIAEELRALGATASVLPIVPDTMEATQAALINAFETADCVVSTGGASVGELDLLKPAFQAIGGRLNLWKVSMKPGKPFVFGTFNGKLWCGLPGNPVSAFVTFQLLVRPILLKLQGAHDLTLPVSWGTLAEPIVNRGDRRHFVRVVLNDAGEVRSAGRQSSHVLSSLSLANGLLDLPPESTKNAGDRVSVLRLR